VNTCERHGRIRCGECAYIEQLEEERQKLIEGLQRMAESDDEWYVGSVPMQKFARDILKEIGIES
jgi:hypothetical protein